MKALLKYPRLFITGTDTGCGKTFITQKLLKQLGDRAVALKPIASGAEMTGEGLRNEDALILQKAASKPLDYHDINPFCYTQPVSPHLAAKHDGQNLTVKAVMEHLNKPLFNTFETVLIEGVGGLMVPLNDNETVLDWILALNAPVILVVGMRLGVLNHALLTHAALQAAGVDVVGWVANQVDPDMDCFDENIETLKQRLPMPHLFTQAYEGH